MAVVNLSDLIDEKIAANIVLTGATKTAKTALGVGAGVGAGDAIAITVMGFEAGKAAVTGNSTAVGWQALLVNTLPSGCTAIGSEALRDCLPEGNHNTAVGHQALRLNTTGSGMLALGHNTLRANTTGTQNAATGTDSMVACVTGSFNTTCGNDTLASTVAGSNNVAVGYESLTLLLTAHRNVGLGYRTLRNATTADSCIAIGADCLYLGNGLAANATITGARQIGIGREAGQASATQRNDAIAIGYRALFDADNTVSLGSGAQALHLSSVALGQGTVTTAASQVMVGDRDIEITDTAKGLIIKSPDGTRYRLQVANGGALSAVAA